MHKTLTILIISHLIILVCIGQSTDSTNKYNTAGQKTGKWVGEWKESGKMAYIENYLNGKKNGLCIYYSSDGRLQNEIDYVNDSVHGIFKFYSPTGWTEISDFKNNKQEGFTRYYNYKGILTEDYEYHNNIRNGIHRIYSEKGNIIMETNFVNGQENGTRKSYYDTDKKEIFLETDFVNDTKVEIRHFKNGKLVKTERITPLPSHKQIKG